AKKTYSFKVGVAGDLPEGYTDHLEMVLQKFKVENMSAGKRTPITERPLDFPQLQNTHVHYYDVELGYPTTPQVLQQYIAMNCGLEESHVIVRDPNAPQEQYQDSKGMIGERDPDSVYTANLGSDMEGADKDAQKQVGANKTMDLLKELEKTRAERENKQVPDGMNNPDQKHEIGEPGKTSPVGSK
ncbi:uncharacterized protein METZ01_LOCUS406538, partial [marine metagenome]